MHLDQNREYNSAFRKKMAGVIGEDEMGDVKTIFVAGSVVVCTTALGETIEGEVIAFDYTRRVLVLSKWSKVLPAFPTNVAARFFLRVVTGTQSHYTSFSNDVTAMLPNYPL